MLYRPHNLIFPKLHFQKETKFKSWGEDGTTRIYELDWDELRKLPEPYDAWVKRFTFALPHHYYEEITRSSVMANIEWGHPKPFDTAVRPRMATVGFIYDAFMLLADCLYDQNKDYFYRGNDKGLVKHAMLHKFWYSNTGRGVVDEFARAHKIRDIVSVKNATSPAIKIYRDFLSIIEKFHERLENATSKASMANYEKLENAVCEADKTNKKREIVPAVNLDRLWGSVAESICPKVPDGWSPDDGLPSICAAGIEKSCEQGPCGCLDISS
jgi:hypothetical protein